MVVEKERKKMSVPLISKGCMKVMLKKKKLQKPFLSAYKASAER